MLAAVCFRVLPAPPLALPLAPPRHPPALPPHTLAPPAPRRCRLAEVCRTFRTLFSAQAFCGRPLSLNLNTLSWRLMERKRRAAARKELVGALARLAPSVSHLCLRYQLDACTGLSLDALLAPLSLYVRRLELEDGVCPPLLHALRTMSRGGWPALEDVSLSGCNLWIDLDPHDLPRLERQLAELPRLTERITKFECCECHQPC